MQALIKGSSLILLLLFGAFSCGSQENSRTDGSTDDSSIVVIDPGYDTLPEPVKWEVPDSSMDAPSKEFLLGKFEPSQDDRFVRIAAEHTTKKGIYLQKDAYDAFIQMREAAQEEGITLTIISATRNFNSQKGIWEAKWNGSRKVNGKDLSKTTPDGPERARTILLYSSMPGTSRHHWGTDIDLNNLNNSWFEESEGKKIYDWLSAHAHEYGYCQVYSPKGDERPEGYEEERWHWSYLPLATSYLKAYESTIDYADIQGFEGSDHAKALLVIDRYVSGINPGCK